MYRDFLPGLTFAAWLALVYLTPPRSCPDGMTYLLSAGGVPVCRPFQWRLWPAMYRGAVVADAEGVALQVWADRAQRWMQAVAVLVTALLLPGPAGLLYLALKSTRTHLSWSWTGDAVALAMAVACGWAGLPWWGLALVGCAAGAWHERGPVFGALFAWSPWPLVGLLVPMVAALVRPVGRPMPHEVEVLSRPLGSALEYHRAAPLWAWVVPWGGALAGLTALDVRGWLVVAVAYGQSVIAVDRTRLYGWAAPVLCVAAAGVLGEWTLVAAALTAAVPWSGDPSHVKHGG